MAFFNYAHLGSSYNQAQELNAVTFINYCTSVNNLDFNMKVKINEAETKIVQNEGTCIRIQSIVDCVPAHKITRACMQALVLKKETTQECYFEF